MDILPIYTWGGSPLLLLIVGCGGGGANAKKMQGSNCLTLLEWTVRLSSMQPRARSQNMLKMNKQPQDNTIPIDKDWNNLDRNNDNDNDSNDNKNNDYNKLDNDKDNDQPADITDKGD